MKKSTKLLSAVLSSAMTLTAIPCYNVLASDKDITVELNGDQITFDVNPQIIDGSTMVPLRKIFEELGAYVKWNGDTQTVSARKNSKTISLSINSDELQIDKGKTDDEGNPIIEKIKLEVPPQIVSDRTLVPARAVSEAFGLDVNWDEKDKKVKINDDKKEDDESWKENKAAIDLDKLSATGEGVEIDGKTISITKGGDFTLSGTLEGGNIVVSTKERVKLRLNGMKITNTEKPCIFVEKADKMFITIEDGTENFLISDTTEDAVVYSKENLEIKGDGVLNITATASHAIKASDNLTIESGTLNLTAPNDGIHINDTFKMTDGNITITATGDGIDCESIINIMGGKINITTNGVPIDNTQKTKDEQATEEASDNQQANMPFGRFSGGMTEAAEVEFEKSSKGINAEWMMCISDAEIKVDSASHAVHCDDEIEITDAQLSLGSEYEKGISAHGNLTINGSETAIAITKSTEGIESKNVMTINDGDITIVSSDDAINATGGNSGAFFPGGGMTPPGNANGLGNGRQPGDKPQGNANGLENGRQPGQMPNGQNNGKNQKDNTSNNSNNKKPEETQTDKNNNQNNGRGQWQGRMPLPPADGTIPAEFEGMTPPDFSNMTPPDFSNMTPPDFNNMTPPANGEKQNNSNRGFGFMGGGRNMKECLIINGGKIDAYAGDDCIDANGNITINGGIVKAALSTGSFLGNFGVLDADGQLKVDEAATLILASGGGSERSFSVPQNSITVYCEAAHESTDTITLKASDGNIIEQFTPNGTFKAVFIASPEIEASKTYTITIGDELHTVEIAEQNTIIGTRASGNGMGFNRNFMRQPKGE